jgi:hypothetical protein
MGWDGSIVDGVGMRAITGTDLLFCSGASTGAFLIPRYPNIHTHTVIRLAFPHTVSTRAVGFAL